MPENKFRSSAKITELHQQQIMDEMQFFQNEAQKHLMERSNGKKSNMDVDDLILWANALPDDIELSGSYRKQGQPSPAKMLQN